MINTLPKCGLQYVNKPKRIEKLKEYRELEKTSGSFKRHIAMLSLLNLCLSTKTDATSHIGDVEFNYGADRVSGILAKRAQYCLDYIREFRGKIAPLGVTGFFLINSRRTTCHIFDIQTWLQAKPEFNDLPDYIPYVKRSFSNLDCHIRKYKFHTLCPSIRTSYVRQCYADDIPLAAN